MSLATYMDKVFSLAGIGSSKRAHLHLLVNATSSDQYLCRLLLSTAVLNFPPPILTKWGLEEDDNALIQTGSKLQKLVNYLDGYSSSEQEDLVLIIDSYDTWFQLGPEVLIRRYFAVIQAADQTLEERVAPHIAKRHDLRHTVVFQSNKLCSPPDPRRVACWSVPMSTIQKDAFAFGPFDDNDLEHAMSDPIHARPRWLDSALVIGPVKDVKDIFSTVLVRGSNISASDQEIMGDMFGEQEYSRGLFAPAMLHPPLQDSQIPDFTEGQKTEYHMLVDYESALYQNVGSSKEFIEWLWFDGDKGQSREPHRAPLEDFHGYELPVDIADSSAPFSTAHLSRRSSYKDTEFSGYGKILTTHNTATDLPMKITWRDLPLATNLITKQVIPVISLGAEQGLRNEYWGKMWFFPFAKQLLRASKVSGEPIFKEPVNGRLWWNFDKPQSASEEEIARSTGNGPGGAWSDHGEWLDWERLCRAHEAKVFL